VSRLPRTESLHNLMPEQCSPLPNVTDFLWILAAGTIRARALHVETIHWPIQRASKRVGLEDGELSGPEARADGDTLAAIGPRQFLIFPPCAPDKPNAGPARKEYNSAHEISVASSVRR
jgi:hypothetical protein